MLTGKELGKAIEDARCRKGVTRSEMARHFGVQPESTYDWTKHGRISKKHIEKLAAYFSDVVGPEHWGMAESDWLPTLGFKQAAGLGHGKRADEWAEAHGLMFRKSFYAKINASPKDCAIFYGDGNSMFPTIQDGDAFLFVTAQTALRKDFLYLLHIDNATDSKEYNVKRYIGDGLFKADNPNDDNDFREPRALGPDDVVLGRVRWIGRMVK